MNGTRALPRLIAMTAAAAISLSPLPPQRRPRLRVISGTGHKAHMTTTTRPTLDELDALALEIVRAANAGDTGRRAQLLERYILHTQGLVWSGIRTILSRKDQKQLREVAYQVAVVTILDAIAHGEPIATRKLTGIGKFKAQDQLPKRDKHARHRADMDGESGDDSWERALPDPNASTDDDAHDLHVSRELMQIARRLATMPIADAKHSFLKRNPRRKAEILIRYLGGAEMHADIARAMDIPEGTIRREWGELTKWIRDEYPNLTALLPEWETASEEAHHA